MYRGQLSSCDNFPCFRGISGGFGVLEPNSPFVLFKLPKHYVLRGKWPILKRNILANRGKTPKFRACTGGGVKGRR